MGEKVPGERKAKGQDGSAQQKGLAAKRSHPRGGGSLLGKDVSELAREST